MKNKKAQGMSTNTIILLILGLAVLAVLIIGFTSGWKMFKGQVFQTNVDSVVQDCQSACGLNQKFSYCSAERDLRVNEENLEVKTSCAVLAGVSNFTRYGIAACPQIKCDLTCDTVSLSGKLNNKPLTVADYDFTPVTGSMCQ
jgi:hypothetical protein